MLPPLLPLLPLLLPLLSTVVYPMMLQVSLGQHFRQDCRVPAANLIGEEGPERPQGYENRGKLKQTWIFYVQRGWLFFLMLIWNRYQGRVHFLFLLVVSRKLICGWKYRVFKRGCRLKYAESAFVSKRLSMSHLWFLWMEDLNDVTCPSFGIPGTQWKVMWVVSIFGICAAKSVKTA